jgi:hypothetical protein
VEKERREVMKRKTFAPSKNLDDGINTEAAQLMIYEVEAFTQEREIAVLKEVARRMCFSCRNGLLLSKHREFGFTHSDAKSNQKCEAVAIHEFIAELTQKEKPNDLHL